MATMPKSSKQVETVRKQPRKVSFGSERSEPLMFDEQGRLTKEIQSVCMNFFALAMEFNGYISFSGNKKGTSVKVRILMKGLEYEEWHCNLEKVAAHIMSLRAAASEPPDGE